MCYWLYTDTHTHTHTHTHTRKFSRSETTWPTAATVNGRDYASTDTETESKIFIKRFLVHAMWAQRGGTDPLILTVAQHESE